MSDLVKAPVPDVMTLGSVFAKSGYFQDARDAAQGVVKILAGQELGFGPVASMTGIYIVKGRVSLSANLIAAAVKKGGKYNYRVTHLDDTACTITFYEGKEEIGKSEFTMEQAKAAGLVNENYRKFARNMLFARAMSNGAKWFCADVFGGPTYTPDELGATVDMETGEMLARPADEPALPPAPVFASPEEAAQEAADRFKTPEEEQEELDTQKDVLLGRIGAGMDLLKLTAAERMASWGKHAPGAAFMTREAEVYQLEALKDELLLRHAAQKGRAKK